MATKQHNLSWMRQYKASSNSYYGSGAPIRVGGSSDFQSFLGIPTSVRDQLKASKTSTTMKLKIFITDATSEWDVGRHKLSGSSEPTSNTMPWYSYLKAVHHTSQGWLTIDLTNDFMNDYKAGTYQGLVLYGARNNLGVADNTGSTRAVIEITGSWNEPPSAPSLTYPTGGEIVDQSLTVRWKAGADLEGDAQKFQIVFQAGDGATKSYYDVGYNVTALTIDTSKAVEGSRARIGVRASDGEGWSSYTYSNYFTIDHNKPPAIPTQLKPVNGAIVNRNGVVRFSWKHNDDGAQAGYKLTWRTVSGGSLGPWNYVPSSSSFMNTTDQFYDMSANTLPIGEIEWTVQTKDQQGTASEYAVPVRFKSADATNAPTILLPTNMGFVNSSRVTVQWSSLNQLEYEIALYDTNGALLWSELKSSNLKLVEIPYDLNNNSWYEIHLRVKDSTSLIWSDSTVVAFGTKFSPPYPPVIKRFEEAGSGIINLFYSASDQNIMPDFLIGQDERNPLLSNYGSTTNEYDILSATSLDLWGASHGLEYHLTKTEIPIIEGATYELSAITNTQGGGLYMAALGVSGNELASQSTGSITAGSPVGQSSVILTLPAGTDQLVVRFYTTSDNANVVRFSGAGLKIRPTTATDKIEIFRREYTPTGMEPWYKIGTNQSLQGAFLDYTPASGVFYEYKVQAISESGETTSESEPVQVKIDFTETYLQEAHNLSNIINLSYASARDGGFKIESALQRFAGRKDPVREFGENEEQTLSVTWQVDSYSGINELIKMWRRRDILLYRDTNGRRLWVTSDSLDIKDKPVKGFEVTAEFTVTSYNEDQEILEGELR